MSLHDESVGFGGLLAYAALGLGMGLSLGGLQMSLLALSSWSPDLFVVGLFVVLMARGGAERYTAAFGVGLAADVLLGSPLGIHVLTMLLLVTFAKVMVSEIPLPRIAREAVTLTLLALSSRVVYWVASLILGNRSGVEAGLDGSLLMMVPAHLALGALIGYTFTALRGTRGRGRARIG